jgi:RimJ/RimL family protein N-acetyltransferase
MSDTHIQTTSLTLVPRTPEEVRAEIDALDPSEKLQLSPDWLALLDASTSADSWIHGFVLVHRDTGIVVGAAGFKGPPEAGGVVEIAYGVAPDYQSQGYATQAAEALVTFAFSNARFA